MIFGIQAPRFQSGSTVVDLDHAKVLDEEPQTDYSELVSEIDGQRVFSARGTSWTVRILVHLFKYADPLAAYQALCLYKGTVVSLFPHRDGREFEGTQFTLKEIATFFLTTTDFKDAAILTFESAVVSLGVIAPGTQGRFITADGKPLSTSDGRPFMVFSE